MRASLPILHNTSKEITERGPKKKVPKRPKERKTERKNLPDVSTVVVVVILVRHSSKLRRTTLESTKAPRPPPPPTPTTTTERRGKSDRTKP
jgi:hypothetical protein